MSSGKVANFFDYIIGNTGIRRLLPRVNRPVITYGFAPSNDLTAEIIESGETSRFTVRLPQSAQGAAESAMTPRAA